MRLRRHLLVACLVPLLAGSALADEFAAHRRAMVEVIARHGSEVMPALGRAALDARVLEVMDRVPRHRFVAARYEDRAYRDRPLPIGYGQTISQPFIVALMTDLLDLEPTDMVLEVGTGSGYQAAVAAHLARRVCSIEIIPELAEEAAARLGRLAYGNVETRTGDGYYGWPECGPFDAIVVTAAASSIPPPLVAQLKPGGRMVIPVGGPFALQYLVLVLKDAAGAVTTRQIIPVRFVPLVGGPT